jgi:hypothetical protein
MQMKITDPRELDLTYPMRWMPSYCQVNPLIIAAYPQMKFDTEAIMIHARTRARLQLAIGLAEYLGLLYFGYRDVRARDTYTLQFINQERLVNYIEELPAHVLQHFNSNVSVVFLDQGERTWFICTFWQQLLPIV